MNKSHSKPTQEARILRYLANGKSLTPLQAIRMFGCFRLGARIYQLKKAGHKIWSENVTREGKRFAKYTLLKLA